MVELRKEMGYATPEEKSNPDDPQEVQPPKRFLWSESEGGSVILWSKVPRPVNNFAPPYIKIPPEWFSGGIVIQG